MVEQLEIRSFEPGDEDELFRAYAEAVEEGGAFPREGPTDLKMLRSAWIEGKTSVCVARLPGGRFAGSYFLRPAYPGSAAHIANAGYLVPRELRGGGIGRALAEHSFDAAREHGFDAMLFTLVLEGNPSRRLWEQLGFERVGRVPDAVGEQAALLYWRRL